MLVLVEREGAVAVVTMNRPEAMNALSLALRGELARAFRELESDDSVRAIVLTGAGVRAFTAGLDLKELGAGSVSIGEAANPNGDGDPVIAMNKCRKPIIGAINGVAITGGFEIALACDILYASSNARFADTHARIGIMPGWGLSQKLSRLVGVHRAKEISLSGNFIDAETANAWGLVNRVFAPEILMLAALKLAHEIADAPAETVRLYKRMIDEGFTKDFGAALSYETETTRARNAALKPEAVEQARGAVMARGREQQ